MTHNERIEKRLETQHNNQRIAETIKEEAYSLLDYLAEQERHNYNQESVTMTAEEIIRAAEIILEHAKSYEF